MAKLSKREKWAQETGRPKEEYPGSSKSKKKKKKKKKSSSKDEKKAKKKIKKYYGEERDIVTKESDTSVSRLQADLNKILEEAGISKTRATEDYFSNLKDIEEGKTTSLGDLNEYVKTTGGKLKENLDASLKKEERRYALEYDKINQSLADRGLTFSERTDEVVAKETSEGIKTEEQRQFKGSYSDLMRYEEVKNRDIEKKYGDLEKDTKKSYGRTTEDINRGMTSKQTDINRGIEDVNTNRENKLRDIGYSEDTDVSTLEQTFEKNELNKKLYDEQIKATGF